MRARIGVFTAAHHIPWPELHRPGRALIYNLLEQEAPALAARLHDQGWRRDGGGPMAPFGFCPPVFPGARRRRGMYAAGGHGQMEIGTPLAALAHPLARALRARVGTVVDWGGVALKITDVTVHDPPASLAGRRAVWETTTPVVARTGARDAPVWLLPADAGWVGCVAANGRRKAALLGLPADFTIRRVLWAGARRTHVTATRGPGGKTGARVRVAVAGHPDVLRALWCWGLGQATSVGMGWIGAPDEAGDLTAHRTTHLGESHA